MKERPILFSGEMVRAILAGRKTQTRRVVKPQPEKHDGGFIYKGKYDSERLFIAMRCHYGQPGERLWVRETFAYGYNDDGSTWQEFRADKEHPSAGKWRPSIHMPRWASRLTLIIKSVRVERLQDISQNDALAEGMEPVQYGCGGFNCPVGEYRELWDEINGSGSWAANPWVWVIEFEREDSV